MTDKYFDKPISKQFEFDDDVASVFDDMLTRSIPFYTQVQDLTTSIALRYLKEGDSVVDLGCSTGSTLIDLAQKSKVKLTLTGIDSSQAMLDTAIKKSNVYELDIDFECADVFDTELNADLVIANYILQFIRPQQREILVRKIYNSLPEGGIFLFSEKVIGKDSTLNKHCIDLYYEFKKQNGYSEFEIAQKREALENVLIPYTDTENKLMVMEAGFRHCESVFKWINFETFVGIK